LSSLEGILPSKDSAEDEHKRQKSFLLRLSGIRLQQEAQPRSTRAAARSRCSPYDSARGSCSESKLIALASLPRNSSICHFVTCDHSCSLRSDSLRFRFQIRDGVEVATGDEIAPVEPSPDIFKIRAHRRCERTEDASARHWRTEQWIRWSSAIASRDVLVSDRGIPNARPVMHGEQLRLPGKLTLVCGENSRFGTVRHSTVCTTVVGVLSECTMAS
jgi:hypothetical protein